MISSDPDDPNGDYTFVPRDADGDECLARWTTADRAGIVDLPAWR